MCVVCGCSGTGDEGRNVSSTEVDHENGDLHFGKNKAQHHVVGISQTKTIELEADILSANNSFAEQNRSHFWSHGLTALNLISSPGSGKTTLLCKTIDALRLSKPKIPVMVIEGDQQTSNDAERIRATGAPAIQVNTGKGCHLDASMVAQAFANLHTQHNHEHDHDHHHAHANHFEDKGLLFIENVGNLVCPALWDLGEAAKIVILSVTEGDDKPMKYPDVFAASELMIINKVDLLPYVNFSVSRCIEFARRINPTIEVIEVSATLGQGMDKWLHWITHKTFHVAKHKQLGSGALEAQLHHRIEEHEDELKKTRAALSIR